LPSILSSEFGEVAFDETEVYLFPVGLPGLEESREYLLLRREGLAPFCFLQSISDAALRLICLPAGIVDPGFVAEVGAEEAGDLSVAAGSYGQSALDVQVLLILTIPEDGPATANLFAPIVLAAAARRGRQCIQFDSCAPVDHPIPWTARRNPRAVA
jgi:flagellar assembly factor FliW